MLFDDISEGIKEAMKAKDAVRRDTLRNVKKVFLEAKTAPGANDELSDADALKILQKLANNGPVTEQMRRESAEIFTQQGRADLAENELAQVRVLEAYLPKQLSEAELESALRAIITQLGVTEPREIGKVMGVATKQLAGKADGKAISAMVKKILA